MAKVLIVEDQRDPLKAQESAVENVGKLYCPDLRYDVARCYIDAEAMIPRGYDIVLLDHRMPIKNMGDLENTDFKQYCRSLENIGYALIDKIKRVNPQTVVIGTSSLSEQELREQPAPDYVMSKMYGTAENDLDKILSEVVRH